MKALQVACIMGAIALTGIYLAAGNRPASTVPDPMPKAAVNAVAQQGMVSNPGGFRPMWGHSDTADAFAPDQIRLGVALR